MYGFGRAHTVWWLHDLGQHRYPITEEQILRARNRTKFGFEHLAIGTHAMETEKMHLEIRFRGQILAMFKPRKH